MTSSKCPEPHAVLSESIFSGSLRIRSKWGAMVTRLWRFREGSERGPRI